jgi:hypothetical protein
MRCAVSAPSYVGISASQVPAGMRWDTPPQHAGQPIEVQYGVLERSADLACNGAPYKRIVDRSVGPCAVSYYRLVEVA